MTKPGELDLTTARLFLRNPRYQESLVKLARQHAPSVQLQWSADRKVTAPAALSVLLNSFKELHSIWSTRVPLTSSQVDLYLNQVNIFRQAWRAFGWKPTPWVHWVLAHSATFIAEYRTLFVFSSIPTEALHRSFKKDLRLTSVSGRHKNPMHAATGLVRLLDRHALDKGLMVHTHGRRPRKRKRTSV